MLMFNIQLSPQYSRNCRVESGLSQICVLWSYSVQVKYCIELVECWCRTVCRLQELWILCLKVGYRMADRVFDIKRYFYACIAFYFFWDCCFFCLL